MTHSPANSLRDSMDLLRFTTAGSVDDGKSTLIGRMLYDSRALFDDQVASLRRAAERRREARLNLSFVTDGLRAEREQGITIDVAYRYFATPRRKFIIADNPGHVQYTRNMVTGASTASLALLMIDARKGVREQTCRHAFIASLLRIPHLIVCVNKMDLVDWSEARFQEIVARFSEFSSRLEIADVKFIPISALHGDNVVEPSKHTPWYLGGPLLYTLETVHIASDANHIDPRFAVQMVIRPGGDAHHDFRGIAGRVSGGVFKPGDEVIALPSGLTTRIKAIQGPAGEIPEAFSPMSVVFTLEEEIDISRGDMIAKPNNQPRVSQDIEAIVCWFSESKLRPAGQYLILHTSRQAKCVVKLARYKIDMNTLHKKEGEADFGMNDIGRLQIRVAAPLMCDPFKRNRITGSFILIDELTNATVAAGMII